MRPRDAIGALAIALPLLASPAGASSQVALSPVGVHVPLPPTAVKGDDDRHHLFYELHLVNFTSFPRRLLRVQVSDAARGRSLSSLEGDDLAASFQPLGRPPATAGDEEGEEGPEPTVVAPGAAAVLYVALTLDPDAPPGPVDSLVHDLVLERADTAGVTPDTARYGPVRVSDRVPVLGPPLEGGDWLAANGPSNTSGHRRVVVPLEGRARIPQRYAIDYVVIDSLGHTFAGDSLDNGAYHAYGRRILSVADGEVIAAKDGIEENVPGLTSRAVPITLETVAGNYLIVDIGDGLYAFYAHIQPGTLRAGVGDRVVRGQVLGLVGNSGNSTQPHLHFHLGDGTTPLGTEGLPYAHDAFEVVGACDLGSGECERHPPRTVRQAIPLGSSLVRFPE